MISPKTLLFVIAASAVAAVSAGVYTSQAKAGPVTVPAQPGTVGYAENEIEPGRYELTFSGHRLSSRAYVEGYLLYRAALIARVNNAGWFTLLYMPGEGGPDDHPARSDAPLGVKYGHWQPHWSYLLAGSEWQPWQPEWGTAFWTRDIAPAQVQGFQAHAMIDLGKGPAEHLLGNRFMTGDVLVDLRRKGFGRSVHTAR